MTIFRWFGSRQMLFKAREPGCCSFFMLSSSYRLLLSEASSGNIERRLGNRCLAKKELKDLVLHRKKDLLFVVSPNITC